MSGKFSKWIAIAGVLLVAIALGCWWRHRASTGGRDFKASGSAPTGTNQTAAIQTSKPPAELLASAADDLAAAQTAEARRPAMARLRETLANGNTNELVAAIRRLLDSKRDAATGQSFKVGNNGELNEAPTLRTLLLEKLASLDPAAAATVAREILDTSTSPDEWAIALRNLGRGDASPEARALLETKTTELLRNEAWQREPSVGYLEAFDTAVFLGGTKLLSPLTELVTKKDNQGVAHAAFLALDRLVISQPAETLSALAQHPEWMQGREETRANYFARADVGDPAQRQLVEAYLLDAARNPAEVQTFVGVFPNANFMISHNLLTTNATLDGATLRRRDAASLDVVNQWLADPRFEKLRPQLERAKLRLTEFVKPAGP
jgi:hypothetical protein